ncbi:hypothetical protein JCM8547_001882 [Rhodosporidiobolus lusitaniae]
MRVAVVAIVFFTSALALNQLPATSTLSLPPQQARRTLPDLRRRHDDDEDEEEEHGMAHEHGEMMEMSVKEDEAAPSATAAPVHAHDEHSHSHSHGPALLELNETDIALHHAHDFDVPSYWDVDQTDEGRPGLLYAHIVCMLLAFFGLLPLTLFLKMGHSSLSILPQTGFLALSILGLFFGQLYKVVDGDHYEGSSHTSWGWFTMILAIALTGLDVVLFLLRLTRWGDQVNFERFSLFQRRKDQENDEEKVFALEDDEDDEAGERQHLCSSPTEMEHSEWRSSSLERHPSRNDSTFSDDTFVEPHSASTLPPPRTLPTRLRRYGSSAVTFLERILIVLAYVEVCNGIAVWTGSCRAEYGNGCYAHIIKGSVFFWYGLLTFARYLGAYSEYGWAWNRMERFGKTGAWSIKDVQHTSIAIMFWAGGALGLMLESRTVRSWLSNSSAQASGRSIDSIPPPASASFPMNPIPAICIGLTGVAMAAHHQKYQFQVDVHALWGNLLGAFALFRLLTYFFLFLRPPASILPSRPPTEALASLCLTAGGVVFILSTEQATFAFMRHGADDVMAILNLTIAFVLAIFVWIAVLFALKGWMLKRNAPVTSSGRAKSTVL